MKKTGMSFLAALAFVCAFSAQAKEATVSDATIVRAIIQESIDGYSGNCPCPYNSARNGSRCGKRSAYSREGGYAPVCFKEDVTKEMISEYRSRLKS
ncbi:hypothetical protein BZK31_17055 [Pseudomonas floridensis]|uniref:Uncharacterized protein n=1 Tax=Pseudomonas floridensis TaxID=1958950 RepID=A0A1X0N3D7_9PSED|nr:hypothetical protein [Pseudomonas floridensis]ORC58024.1 hypothetical protein BZK31_17055 [Pseudomonas floridensis]